MFRYHAHSSLLTIRPSSSTGPAFHLKGKFLFRSTPSHICVENFLTFLRQNLNSGPLQVFCIYAVQSKTNQCLLVMHPQHLCKFVPSRDCTNGCFCNLWLPLSASKCILKFNNSAKETETLLSYTRAIQMHLKQTSNWHKLTRLTTYPSGFTTGTMTNSTFFNKVLIFCTCAFGEGHACACILEAASVNIICVDYLLMHANIVIVPGCWRFWPDNGQGTCTLSHWSTLLWSRKCVIVCEAILRAQAHLNRCIICSCLCFANSANIVHGRCMQVENYHHGIWNM